MNLNRTSVYRDTEGDLWWFEGDRWICSLYPEGDYRTEDVEECATTMAEEYCHPWVELKAQDLDTLLEHGYEILSRDQQIADLREERDAWMEEYRFLGTETQNLKELVYEQDIEIRRLRTVVVDLEELVRAKDKAAEAGDIALRRELAQAQLLVAQLEELLRVYMDVRR